MNYKLVNEYLLDILNHRLSTTLFKLEVKRYQHDDFFNYELIIKKDSKYFIPLHCELTARELYLILSTINDSLFYGIFPEAINGDINHDT